MLSKPSLLPFQRPTWQTEVENDNQWIAVYDYEAASNDELSLHCGQIVEVISKDFTKSGDEGWWIGNTKGKVGVFPCNFTTKLTTDIICYMQSQALYGKFNDDSISRYFLESNNRVEKQRFSVKLQEIDYNELETKDFLGAGGFGKVYSGFFNNNEVAIKLAKVDNINNSDDVLKNVLDEARLFSLLNHKNIIGLFGVCLKKPNLCIVLEYAKGGALNHCLAGRPLPPAVLVDWARQIAEGMDYLHSKAPIPLIHRDLKSSNGEFLFHS